MKLESVNFHDFFPRYQNNDKLHLKEEENKKKKIVFEIYEKSFLTLILNGKF